MKKLTCLFTVILPLLAFSQTPVPYLNRSVNEFRKSVITENLYQKTGKSIFETKLKQIENFKKSETPFHIPKQPELVPNEFNLQHETIERIRKNLANITDEALPDSILTYSYSSDGDSTLIQKVIFGYNDAFQHLFYNVYIFNENLEKWTSAYREEYYPNELGQDTIMISYAAGPSGSDWVPQTKMETAFDPMGNQTTTAWYFWDSDNHNWFGEYKYESGYDENNNQIMSADYYWNYTENTWTGSYRSEVEYDANGNLISYTSSMWDESKNSWVKMNKTEYHDDFEQLQSSSIFYVWDELENTWIPQNKEEYISTENGYQFSYYYWDLAHSNWMPEYELENVYDLDSGVFIYITTLWDEFTGKIISREKMEAAIDEFGNNQYEKVSVWNDSANEWMIQSQTEYTYDDQNRNIEILQTFRKDTLFNSHLICAMDSVEAIDKVTGDYACQGNKCLVADTIDFVEGSAALSWNYNARGTEYWGGFSQINIQNIPDLSGDDGVFLYYKIHNPTNAQFVLIFLESSGEEWRYVDYNMLSGAASGWKKKVIRFEDFYLSDYQNPKNSILDLNDIKSIQIQLFAEYGMIASGSILMDNFSGYISEATDNWATRFREIKKYNQNDKVVADSIFNWDEYLQKTILTYYSKAEYDEKGKITLYESYWWDRNIEKWYGETKNESTYNERGFLNSSIDYTWDYNEMNWIIQAKQLIEYNTTGLETRTETYYRDWDTNELIGNSKHELTYDSNNNITSEVFYFWDDYQKNWIGSSKMERFFNSGDELIKTFNYTWNYETSNWDAPDVKYIEKYDLIFDEKGNLNYEIVIQWNENEKQWDTAKKSYYFFNTVTSAVTFQKPDYLTEIYPNPARDVVNLRLINVTEATVVFFDSKGKAVKSTYLTKEVTPLHVSDLSPGLYIIKTKTSNTLTTKKLLIQ